MQKIGWKRQRRIDLPVEVGQNVRWEWDRSRAETGTVDKKKTKENTILKHVCNVHTIFLMILALELRTSLGLYIRSLCSWLVKGELGPSDITLQCPTMGERPWTKLPQYPWTLSTDLFLNNFLTCYNHRMYQNNWYLWITLIPKSNALNAQPRTYPIKGLLQDLPPRGQLQWKDLAHKGATIAGLGGTHQWPGHHMSSPKTAYKISYEDVLRCASYSTLQIHSNIIQEVTPHPASVVHFTCLLIWLCIIS